jgi:hypothetical protein
MGGGGMGGGGGGMGGGGGGGMGGGGGGGMAGTMNGPVEGVNGVVGPGAMGNWGGSANGGNGIIGQRFDIVFTAEDGGKKTISSLSFGQRDIACAFLERNWSVEKLAYEGHGKGFAGTLSDSGGNSLKLVGTIDGNKVKGTLTLHQATGDRSIRYEFHGGISGTAPADQALQEANPGPAKAR